jgi:predicted nucleic-acid-binding protein
MKMRKIAATAVALTLLGAPLASADNTNVTPEAKAAHQAAKATFKANIEAYRTARTAAKAQITAAKTTFDAAKGAASTAEAKKAARDAFLNAKKAALASVPTKPTKPLKP